MGIKTKTLAILATVLAIVIGVGLIFTISRLNGTIKTKEISVTAYSVGALDTETGKFKDVDTSIYTKDYIECDGLEIKVQEDDLTVQYAVVFYDEDKIFVSATALSDKDYTETVPETAKYCRIMITPDEDAEVTTLEISKYAKQITVTVNK